MVSDPADMSGSRLDREDRALGVGDFQGQRAY